MTGKFISCFLSGLLLFCCVTVNARIDPVATVREMWKAYSASGCDSTKICHLAAISSFYYNYLNDRRLADSISELAVEIAEQSYNARLLLEAYNNYIESNDIEFYHLKALDYSQKAWKLCLSVDYLPLQWRTCRNVAEVYLALYQYDKALEFSYKALSVASTLEKDPLKAESYLYIGRSLEGRTQKIEAFRNYFNATSLAEKLGDHRLLIQCYSNLSSFYNYNKLYDKATLYKLKQGNLIRNTRPVDSVALIWTLYDLQVIDITSNNNKLILKNVQEILGFAIRNSNLRLRNFEIALYRTHLIEADQISELYDLYTSRFPDDFRKIAKSDPALYFKLKAFFCEKEKKVDSAFYYFSKAGEYQPSDPNKIHVANFYIRYGQFLMRHGRTQDAIDKFRRSFELASQASYFEYMLTASRQLELLYAGMNDFRSAYACSAMNRALADSINNMSKKDQMVMLEIDHEARQREFIQQQDEQQRLRRHNIQYTAITIIGVVVFFILIMVGSFRVPEWVIKALGFFSFVFLFEFIVMIADHKINALTGGEPWKVLLIKIVLIGMLLPFHQWLEHKVIEYLLSHRLIDISKFSFHQVFHWQRLEKKKR